MNGFENPLASTFGFLELRQIGRTDLEASVDM